MELLVVGAGTMGRWFADVLDATVAFGDVDPSVAEAAAASVGGRAVPLDADDRFDVVCIAVPMRVTEAAIAEHASKARTAVVDLSGVMAGPVAAMAEAAPDYERMSLHPLFAPINAPGRIAVVVDAPGSMTDGIREALAAGGYTLLDTTPEEHDRAMETVQARAHAALLSFALAAEDVPEGFGTPIYDRLMALLADFLSGTPRVYADIQATFDGADDVADAAQTVASADPETFERLYRDSRG